MAENRIQYTTRNYQDIKNSLTEITRRYYPSLFNSLSDASIGEWMIDINSDIYDTLMYNIDRAYQETAVESANSRESLINMARTLGVRIPGPKSAIVEVEISCNLPLNTSAVEGSANDLAIADESYAPYIKRGSLFSDGSNTFELMEDVDFKKQFDMNGMSNRKMIPRKNANGQIIGYKYKKLAIAAAGQSKIFKRFVSGSDLEPFMKLTLQDNSILGVESIILKEGRLLDTNPAISEFYVDKESYEDREGRPTMRFFEVDNLIDQYRFGYEEQFCERNDGGPDYYNPVWEAIDVLETEEANIPLRMAVRGKWKRLKNKFITEYTERGMLDIIFGSGLRNMYGCIPDSASEYTKYRMSRMAANDYMGVLPEPNTTMFILYRVGGGDMTNIGANTLTNIISLACTINGNCNDPEDNRKKQAVRSSIEVTNPTQSYGGKDAPTNDEIKYMMRFISGEQNRCVTLNDYYSRLMQLPAKYGTPFRCGVVEENNKVIIYTLGLDYNGWLTSLLSETVAENIKEYLSNYRMINDYVEIRSGRIINLSFEVDVYIDKSYDRSEVSKRIIELIRDYMDIRKWQMGQDIFIGDLEKEISKLDGVVNLIDLRCYNKVGDGYSDTKITQQLVENTDVVTSNNQIDLQASEKTLFADTGTMFEIKYSNDVVVGVRER